MTTAIITITTTGMITATLITITPIPMRTTRWGR